MLLDEASRARNAGDAPCSRCVSSSKLRRQPARQTTPRRHCPGSMIMESRAGKDCGLSQTPAARFFLGAVLRLSGAAAADGRSSTFASSFDYQHRHPSPSAFVSRGRDASGLSRARFAGTAFAYFSDVARLEWACQEGWSRRASRARSGAARRSVIRRLREAAVRHCIRRSAW